MVFTLRVAYVPEHFSTPLFFAEQEQYYASAGLKIEFTPVIEGTGRLIKLLNENTVDIAIGLTEAFIADVAKGNDVYSVVGSYVKSPLCWAISTGINRTDITLAEDLQGKRIGVSRIGSGSYIMSFVLGLDRKFDAPFFSEHPAVSNFKNLRDSVNLKEGVDPLDAFMWEHFTSKKYYDNKEIKRVGEIYTPWPSWVITARRELLADHREEISAFLKAVNKGIQHFKENPKKATEYIAANLDYSEADATLWLATVKFNEQLGDAEIDWEKVVENTARVLKTAGVLTDSDAEIRSRLEAGVVRKI